MEIEFPAWQDKVPRPAELPSRERAATRRVGKANSGSNK